MIARLVVLIALLGLLTGAPMSSAQPQTVPDGPSAHAITVDGLQRSYRVYRPAGLPAAAPLVLMLHGGFGSAEQAERRYGWDELADTAKFVVAYPDGLARAWNTGSRCCGRPAGTGVDDIGFLTAVVDEIGRGVGIDPARIYATGMSNGGIMAYTLACNTGVFAAIGPVAATQLGACPGPQPVSVLHIHGIADQQVRYDGGPGSGVARIDGPPVADVAAFWRNVDGCAAPDTRTDGTLTIAAADCPEGRSVQLITVDGGGHDWPDFATATLWQFFAAHPG